MRFAIPFLAAVALVVAACSVDSSDGAIPATNTVPTTPIDTSTTSFAPDPASAPAGAVVTRTNRTLTALDPSTGAELSRLEFERTVSSLLPVGEPGQFLILQPPSLWLLVDLRDRSVMELGDALDVQPLRSRGDQVSAALITTGERVETSGVSVLETSFLDPLSGLMTPIDVTGVRPYGVAEIEGAVIVVATDLSNPEAPTDVAIEVTTGERTPLSDLVGELQIDPPLHPSFREMAFPDAVLSVGKRFVLTTSEVRDRTTGSVVATLGGSYQVGLVDVLRLSEGLAFIGGFATAHLIDLATGATEDLEQLAVVDISPAGSRLLITDGSSAYLAPVASPTTLEELTTARPVAWIEWLVPN